MDKSPDAFRTISEVADDLGLPQHVLRFWETRFAQIKPMKRTGGRRYYRPDDVELVRAIKHLLYGEGYTIKGVQRLFKENGARAVVAAVRGGAALAPSQAAFALEEENDGDAGADSAESGADEPDFVAAEAAPLSPQFAEIARELAECARILRAARSG
ncbi:MAG: MerR family transcriptional regulator [Rhodoblastus sp.]